MAAGVSEGRRSRVVPAARLLLLVLAVVVGWGAVAAAGGTGHALGVTLAGEPAPTASTAPAALRPPAGKVAGDAPGTAAARRERRDAASRSKVRLDPRFAGCSPARAAGLGPYERGRDPEYVWYPDADGDGVACDEPAGRPADQSVDQSADQLADAGR